MAAVVWERERDLSPGSRPGESDSEIARALGRHRSTIGREIRAAVRQRRRLSAVWRPSGKSRGSSRGGRRRPSWRLSPRLLAAVEAGLAARAGRRSRSRPAEARASRSMEAMRISHETIYRSLYVQSRGELRRQLTANAADRPHAAGAPQGARETRGRIVGMVPIAERPPEVDDRARPGPLGRRSAASAPAAGRRSRRWSSARPATCCSPACPRPHRRSTVIDALKQRIQTLPAHLVSSLTWDQGARTGRPPSASPIDTGIEVYFCDPHSPWQRGSNENTNGLLRQYLPRKHRSGRAQHRSDLDQIAAELNGRPRKTLRLEHPS